MDTLTDSIQLALTGSANARYPVSVQRNSNASITVSYSDGSAVDYAVEGVGTYAETMSPCPGYLTYSRRTRNGPIYNYWYTYTEGDSTTEEFVLILAPAQDI